MTIGRCGAMAAPTAVALALLLVAGAAASAEDEAPAIQFLEAPPASTEYLEYNNVRDLGAKGDGVTDDTAAFQKGLADRKKAPYDWTVLYVPEGTYLVSDTLGWPLRTYLIGEGRDKTIMKLRDNCPGFTDGRGKPVLATAIRAYRYGNDSRVNAAFANYILNLTVDTGEGNPGAVGIRYTTHNSGILGEVTVRSGDGRGKVGVDLSDTEFGPGMLRNVTVEGFDIGIDTPGNVSHATLAGITLRGQNKVGLVNRFPITVHGLTSVNTVPAVRNDGGMAHLVLLDADLSGGDARTCAIQQVKGTAYLRNIRSRGYRAALSEAGAPGGRGTIDERIIGPVKTLFPSPAKSLKLPIPTPPPTFTEPMSKWRVVDDSAEDDTNAVQQAFDSGDRTIYFKYGSRYSIRDTVRVGGGVRRIVGFRAVLDGRDAKDVFVGTGKPLLRFVGDGKHPITMEWLGVSAWPWSKQIVAIEIDTPRDLCFRSCGRPSFRTTKQASGTVFVGEHGGDTELNGPGTFVIRQCNTENNPFSAGKKLPRTYFRNRGSNLIILGMKTEAPAVHVVTTNGGKTEVLGGFFRDHVGPADYRWHGEPPLAGVDMSKGVPYWITRDGSITATYYQYAWRRGKARSLQAVETRDGETKYLIVEPGNFPLGLYSGIQGDAKPTGKPTVPPADVPEGAVAFGGHHYLLHKKGVKRDEAVAACRKLGGRLVRIDSAEENSFVWQLVNGKMGKGCWIDGSDEGKDGQWKHSDGSPLGFTFWKKGQPDGKNKETAIIYLQKAGRHSSQPDGRWYDAPAAKKYAYVCEWGG